MTTPPVLEIRNLCVDYGVGRTAAHAVIDASLVLREKGVLGLAGESGSGKSTLVYGATRLLREPGVVTGGEVLLHPRHGAGTAVPGGDNATTNSRPIDLLDLDERALRDVRWSEISVVLQSALNALNPVLRVGHEFDDLLKAHPGGHRQSREGRKERAIELLAMVGLGAERLRSYPHELSGGQRQRVMIALALALRPRVVIMDEPTTALDVVTQREILEELDGLRNELGFAVLFITHDLSLLVELADEIAVMYAGRIVERAPARELFFAPRHPYTLGLLNSFPPMHGKHQVLTGIPGSPPDLREVPTGCPFRERCAYAMARCALERPALEVTGGEHEVACFLHDRDHEGGVGAPPELSRELPVAVTVER